jgi:hypothetical protein
VYQRLNEFQVSGSRVEVRATMDIQRLSKQFRNRTDVSPSEVPEPVKCVEGVGIAFAEVSIHGKFVPFSAKRIVSIPVFVPTERPQNAA